MTITTRRHTDIQPPVPGVYELAPGAVCRESSATHPNETVAFPGEPICATHFHTELQGEDLAARPAASPYLKSAGVASLAEFRAYDPETADTASLLRRFPARLAATGSDAVPP